MRSALTVLIVSPGLLLVVVALLGNAVGPMYRSNVDLDTQIALGHVSTHGKTWQSVFKFGKNITVSGAAEDIWDCPDLTGAGNVTYPFPGTAQTLYVSSSDGADETRTITIEGLDSTWAAQSETVALGPANVTSGTAYALVGDAANWMRVFRAYNNGSTAYAGDIYIHTDPDADTGDNGIPDSPSTQLLACITAGQGQTQMAIYTVPLGFSAQLVEMWTGINPAAAGATTRSTNVDLFVRLAGGVFRVQETFGLQVNGNTETSRRYGVLRTYPAKTDIKIRSQTPSAAVHIAANLGLRLVPDGT